MQLGQDEGPWALMLEAAAAMHVAAARASGERRSMMHDVGEHDTGAVGRPTLVDRVRGFLQDPTVVTWRCGGCGWELWCDYSSRRAVHTCDECGWSQRVPPVVFAWNERMARHFEAISQSRRLRREREEAARRIREEAAHREHSMRRASMRLAAASIAVNAGLIASAPEFDEVSDAEAVRILELASLARSLAADLRAAGEEAATADGGERVVREGAGWGSLACLMFGSFWMAAGLTAASWATREVARDWKQSRADRYRQRWEQTVSRLSVADATAFMRIFACLQPQEAAAAAALLRA
jgi:hypothetical protein